MTREPATVPPSRFAERRERVQRLLGDRGALVLAAAPVLRVGADRELRYIVDSDLYYLTGYAEPDAVLVLTGDTAGFTLFVRPRDPERERWEGPRGGEDAARTVYGAASAHPISTLAQELPRLLAGADRVYVRSHEGRPAVDAAVRSALDAGRRSRSRKGSGLSAVADPGLLLDDLRLIKDADEILLLRHAADVSVRAFREAAAQIRDGAGEWEIEAALQAGFRGRRAMGEAFPTIVGAGANGTVLHYTANDSRLAAGDYVLVDAGARWGMYCADLTRTWAVGGSAAMSTERLAAHEIVRAAHDAGIAACAVGSTLEAVEIAARRALVQGMIDLKLIAGPLDDALTRDEYQRYYPHRTAHWLGLDVHDAGTYADPDGDPRRLEAGMVFTIEPGLYIPANDAKAPAPLRGVGIRLEDDILMTASGPDVLTAALPLDADPSAAALRDA
jgi:Xaa-Pro aminopeptidase